MSGSLRSLPGTLPLLALLGSPAVADVLVVAADGSGDFLEVQNAVDAAVDGDTLLVHPGTYLGFDVPGRSIAITSVTPGLAIIDGTVRVRDLGADQTVTLSGLTVNGGLFGPVGLNWALRLQDNAGSFVAQDCDFTANPSSPTNFGFPAASITSSASSAFIRCQLVGGQGPFGSSCCSTGASGGSGVEADGGGVLTLFECTATGATGGLDGWGGPGGHGVAKVDGELHVHGSDLTGGRGGQGTDFIFGPGGDGGHALQLGAAATAYLRDNLYEPGEVGDSVIGSPGGQPGAAISGGGTVNQLPGPHRRSSGLNVAWSNAGYRLGVEGQPGDSVRLAFSDRIGNVLDPQGAGVWMTPLVTKITPLPLLTIPAGGTAELSLPTWRVGQLLQGERWVLQLLVTDTGGVSHLSTPSIPTRLVCDLSQDCDGNGQPDACDVVAGLVADCNGNGIPDTCDLADGVTSDCNGNGVPDTCDVDALFSTDCNGDLVPDECQSDCNANGVLDECDVFSGSSPDCDGDLIPDECNIDCNSNGIPDACDLAASTSPDQNGNGVPDECQGAGDVYYVDPAGTAWGDGSLASPFADVRRAVDYAIGGNEIVLLDGLYLGPENRDLSLGSRNLRIRSQNGPASCVFDLDGRGRAFLLGGGQTSATVIEGITFRGGVAPDGGDGGAIALLASQATLRGCVFEGNGGNSLGGAIFVSHPLLGPTPETRIEDCTFTGDTGYRGGSIAAAHRRGRVVVRDCTFRNCTANGGSAISLTEFDAGELLLDGVDIQGCVASTGAVQQRGGSLLITRSVIAENSSNLGGGIQVANGNRFWLSHTTLAGNTASSSQGGALSVVDPDASLEVRIDNCLVFANTAGTIGGGFLLRDADDIEVTSCSFFLNQATRGGAVLASGPSSAVVRNSLFWENSAANGGDSFWISSGSTLDLDWCNLQQGHASTFTASGGALVYGANNSSFYPGFVDPDGADNDLLTWQDNDVRLGPSSAARDAGDSASVARDRFDLDGDGDELEPVPFDLLGLARQVDSSEPDTGSGSAPLVDLGCYEDQ